MSPLTLNTGKGLSFSQGQSGGKKSRGFGGVGLAAVNPFLILVVLALIAAGLITLYPVTQTDTDYSFMKQVAGICIGVVVMIVVWILDYRMLSHWTLVLFILDIVVILLPLIPGLGMEVNGATSWVKLGPLTFQPSELAKPLTILMLASYVGRFEGNLVKGTDFLKALGLIIVPFVLLAKEDLGTGLVLLFISFVILFVGGAARHWLITSIMVCVVGIVALFLVNSLMNDWTNGEKQLIKSYQMSRLMVFIDQDNPDYADDAYNLTQAEIAIGSGEVTGKGWGNATQSSGGFLPESATDFIFCVYAEQFGFLGVLILLVLYLALLAVALSIALRAADINGSLIAGGIMGMWLFQILENIGMDIGLMPITGIPLPFMSYGSSFMVVNFICIGLLSSVWARRGAVAIGNGKGA